MKLSLNDDACRCLVFVVACIGVLVPMVILDKGQTSKDDKDIHLISDKELDEITYLVKRNELIIANDQHRDPTEESIQKAKKQFPNGWIWRLDHTGQWVAQPFAKDRIPASELLD